MSFQRYRTLGLALLLAVFWLAYSGLRGAAQAPDPELLQEGARLYSDNCAVCHGAEGEGRVGATLAKDWPSIRPELTVRTIIENGVPGSVMPAWSEQNGGPLSKEQIDALVAYILSWQTGGAPDLTPQPTYTPHPPITPIPNVEGDPNAGAILFADNCAVCHGPNGEGRVGATLAKNWSSIRPDLSVKQIIQQGVTGSVMPAWSQAHGGPLDEGQINNLVAFILTRPSDTVLAVSPTVAPFTRSLAPFLEGWAGLLLAAVIFIVLIIGVLLVQRRSA